MITKEVIDSIYKQFNKRPSHIDKLDLGLLLDRTIEHHTIYVEDGNLIIDSVNPDSPFHKIPLSNINEIVEFERAVAIVMHSSILFINKNDSGVNVHIREQKLGFIDRAIQIFGSHD